MCTEEKLINKAKMGDDQALKELFFLYKPLVNSILKKYYLHHYDRDDWEQEALIICYESVVVFSGKKGSFGSLYKTKLSNHARTLVRYNNELRRQIYNHSVSLDSNLCIQEPGRSELITPVKTIYHEFIESLSRLELIAVLTILGEISVEYVINNLKIEYMQLVRARSRAIQKMRNVLF